MSIPSKLTVAYDCTFLGLGYINPKSRTGIYRVVQDGLLALLNQPSINLKLSSIGDQISAWNEAASKLCLRTLNLNLEDKLIASYPSWVHSSLSLPIKFQKKIIENSFQSLPLLYKGGLALQIPVDSLTQNGKKHLAHPNFDVYHSSFLALPSILSNLNIPRVLTVHDLIPVLFPQFCTQRTLDRFKEILNSINPEKDWIICVSEATKNDLCEYIKIDPARVFVVPNAASKYFQRVENDHEIDAVVNGYGLAKKSYLLSLSTIEPRKNLKFLIESFIRVIKENPNLSLKLVLVGPSGWKNASIFQAAFDDSAVASRIVFTGYLPDEELAAIYSGSLAFVYPSIYEGFGLPPLEAMQCGVPVIASRTSSLPEVVGDAGILIDPESEDELCQAIVDVASSKDLQSDLSRRSLERAKQFSWARYANEVSEVYRLAANSA